jgi:hypothetical protein
MCCRGTLRKALPDRAIAIIGEPASGLNCMSKKGIAMATTVDDLIENFKQWNISPNSPSGPILPKASFTGPADRNYSLKGKAIRKFLQWEDQTWGINLGWTDNAEPETEKKVRRWFFTRNEESAAGKTPIRYGETIAIGNGNRPSFLNYDSREFGINLSWENSPSFEWKILGGTVGEPVMSDEWVALYNLKSESGECLIFFDRTVGGDIGWPSSQTWTDQFKDLVRAQVLKLAKDAVMAMLAA